MFALRNTMSFALAALLAVGLTACGTEEEAPMSDASADAVGDAGGDDVDTPDTEPGDAAGGCSEPDPSVDCQTLGCPSGSSCVLDPNGCAPSTCSCDEGADAWLCTTDCGPAYVCEVDVAPSCPDLAPEPGSACDASVGDGECTWGEECCCGECYPSFACSCEDGTWACYATDACFIESCIGRPCDADSDCEGGLDRPAVCEEGICVDATLGCGDIDAQPGCDARPGCEWVLPSACPELGGPDTIGAAGCYPDTRCVVNEECPDGSVCAEVSLAPRCYWEDPLCDACDEQRTLCMPAER